MAEQSCASHKVAEYDERDLKSVGKLRLEKLSKFDLCELFRRVASKTETPFHESTLLILNTAELVDGILEMKELIKLKEKIEKPKLDPKPKLEETSETPKPDLIVKRHGIRICFFNCLKLRVDREGLLQQWLALSAVFASFDVIMMAEVPAPPTNPKKRADSTFEKRINGFAELLRLHTDEGREWSMLHSRPSGAFDATGKLSGNHEVHVCFVKSPVRIVLENQSWGTLERIGDVKLDYAPLSVLVEDPRFQDENERTFLITSVHLPPSNRHRARDAQLKALIRHYPLDAGARLSTPFTAKGARDAKLSKPTHLICGDFNIFPNDTEYGLTKNGWAPPLIGELVSTSSGKQNYDNFILDAEAQRRFQTSAEVLELSQPQKSGKGEIGLSDHNPIVLLIKDAQNTKNNHTS